MSALADNRHVARMALEQVCARGDMGLAPQCYAEDFADHAGDVDYHGLEGVRRSTAGYRALLDDLRFEVVDQVAEDDRRQPLGDERVQPRAPRTPKGDHDQPPASPSASTGGRDDTGCVSTTTPPGTSAA
jgi:hypothetical protein